MKRFILSDLHIGHKDAQYNVMDQAIIYIRQEAKAGDWVHRCGGAAVPAGSEPLFRELRSRPSGHEGHPVDTRVLEDHQCFIP